MIILFAFAFFACSDENIEESIEEDLTREVVVYSENPSDSESTPNSATFFYKLGETITSARLISECMGVNLKPGYKIKALTYYKNLTADSTTPASSINLSEDLVLSSFQMRMDTQSFYVSDFDEISYTLAFDANGGSGTAPESQKLSYEKDYELPANPFTRSDCSFQGWKINGTRYAAGDFVSKLTTTDGATVTAYAYWIKEPITVTFDGNGGTTSSGETSYSTQITLSSNSIDLSTIMSMFSRDGYNMGGIVTSPNGNTEFGTYTYNDAGPAYTYSRTVDDWPTSDVTAYIKWYQKESTLSYWSGGSTYTGSDDYSKNYSYNSYSYGETITLKNGEDLFPHTGYTFINWQDANGTSYSAGEEITLPEMLVLTAVWDSETMTITYDANGGTLSSSSIQNVVHSSTDATKSASDVSKTGYVCKSWNTSASGNGTSLDCGTSVTWSRYWNSNGLTLYAQWKPRGTVSSLPSGVSYSYNSDGTGITFTTANESSWVVGLKSESGSEYVLDYPTSSTTYTVFVFVNGSSTPSSFTVTVE